MYTIIILTAVVVLAALYICIRMRKTVEPEFNGPVKLVYKLNSPAEKGCWLCEFFFEGKLMSGTVYTEDVNLSPGDEIYGNFRGFYSSLPQVFTHR